VYKPKTRLMQGNWSSRNQPQDVQRDRKTGPRRNGSSSNNSAPPSRGRSGHVPNQARKGLHGERMFVGAWTLISQDKQAETRCCQGDGRGHNTSSAHRQRIAPSPTFLPLLAIHPSRLHSYSSRPRCNGGGRLLSTFNHALVPHVPLPTIPGPSRTLCCRLNTVIQATIPQPSFYTFLRHLSCPLSAPRHIHDAILVDATFGAACARRRRRAGPAW
jgi:hypothetical protein